MAWISDTLILRRERDSEALQDITHEVAAYAFEGHRIRIHFSAGDQGYPYGRDRISLATVESAIAVAPTQRVYVNASQWKNVTSVDRLTSDFGVHARIVYGNKGSLKRSIRPYDSISIMDDGGSTPAATSTLKYFRSYAQAMPDDDAVHRPLQSLLFIHPESALASYLNGTAVDHIPSSPTAIHPFGCNLSQMKAVDNALTHRMSIIEGPPGTGKTHTILNLIASLVATGEHTVGVVSCNNSAVDNVAEKLANEGIDFLAADLGRKARREHYFAHHGQTVEQIRQFSAQPAPIPADPTAFAKVENELQGLREDDRRLAQVRQRRADFALELANFDEHLAHFNLHDIPELTSGKARASTALRYLADIETAPPLDTPLKELMWSLKRTFVYRNLPRCRPGDPIAADRLKREFYCARLRELDEEILKLERRLAAGHYVDKCQQHATLSLNVLQSALTRRYAAQQPAAFTKNTMGEKFKEFSHQHPVLLSTCYSLVNALPAGALLDYLIIDEASQVTPLVASLAMGCARNLVIVGDSKQLEPVRPNISATAPEAPHPAYNLDRHSILTSLKALYGESIPQTLLREHYRCDAAIIGYCNRAFYNGELIPYTATAGPSAMEVRLTTAGGHLRKFSSGGIVNQREVDMIREEVFPELNTDAGLSSVGIATPYRGQADLLAQRFSRDFDGANDASTVHSYQGREKDIMILSTVLDTSQEGKRAASFADNAQLINVAVSRAKRKIVLVTHYSLLPQTKNINDLIKYIHYQNPGATQVSSIISVFDLLYKESSPILRALHSKRRGIEKSPAEDIMDAFLAQILADEKYSDLTVTSQVALRDVVPSIKGLNDREVKFLAHGRTSLDFVIYSRVSNAAVLAIEVDGWAYHADKPEQQERDVLKRELLARGGVPLLPLPTNGSNEERKIREALDAERPRPQSWNDKL